MQGLTSTEANTLLQQYGKNTIADGTRKNILVAFGKQFTEVLTVLLLLAAGLSFAIGERVDAILIALIVMLNAVFRLYQEFKAEEALRSLKNMAITVVRVIRDGKETELDSQLLVPGDTILIDEGGKIPADAELLEAVNLEVNEAALTGESIPVYKNVNDQVFMGTVVVKGHAVARIVTTGMKTRFGEVAGTLSKVVDAPTPLQRKLTGLLRVVGGVGIVASFIVLALSYFHYGNDSLHSIILAVSLAVAIVPEGLPAVMTVTLALGVRDMAKKKAIVRKLDAIEAIGSVTLIATDKTGTLTSNEMSVKEVWFEGKTYQEDQIPTAPSGTLLQLLTNGILCSTASLIFRHDHGSWDILGDPTEGALLVLAQKKGVIPEKFRQEWELLKEIPFDTATKIMRVTVRARSQISDLRSEITYTKGAPEVVIKEATHILRNGKAEALSESGREEIKKQWNEWTSKGLRVLAFSYSYADNSSSVFIGMTALHDPPRHEVKEAVRRAHEAGIQVVMITGDNEKTAESIGVMVGIIKEGDLILTGQQVEEATDEELLEKLDKVKAFARTTPLHKSRIVSLYQKLGHVVAVTGDGVNDAIALKQADVGLSMGKVGTDVARETSDIIITDDNFATIVQAVEEGRHIVRNLKNAIKYLFSTNASEALTLIIGMFLGIPSILYAIQILYINLIGDGIPALALAFSPREEGMMSRHPEKKLTLLKPFDGLYIGLVAFIATIIILTVFFAFRSVSESFAQTAAFSVLAMVQSYVFMDLWLSHRSIHRHYRKFISPLFIFAFLMPIILQFIIVTHPPIAEVFKVEIIPFVEFIKFVTIAASVFVGIVIVKRVLRYKEL
jgi:Ca2+-transporting ATPase